MEMNVEKCEGGIYAVKAMVVAEEELEDTAECLAHIIGEKSEGTGFANGQGRVSVPTGVLMTGPDEEEKFSGESVKIIGGTPMTKQEFP
jgi:hypothetical protein